MQEQWLHSGLVFVTYFVTIETFLVPKKLSIYITYTISSQINYFKHSGQLIYTYVMLVIAFRPVFRNISCFMWNNAGNKLILKTWWLHLNSSNIIHILHWYLRPNIAYRHVYYTGISDQISRPKARIEPHYNHVYFTGISDQISLPKARIEPYYNHVYYRDISDQISRPKARI